MKNKLLLSLCIFLCGAFLGACGSTPVDTAAAEPLKEASGGGGADSSQDELITQNVQTQFEPTPGSQEVVGWLGYVVSPAEGGDDKLVWMPEGTGSVGLTGATPELESQIIALRDADEPGKYAHFWGNLANGVEDFNNSQLVVTRIRVGDTATDPEPITGWEGLISESVFNSSQSHVLTFLGEYPMQFSIDSNAPALKEQISALSGTTSIVRVSGDLITGVPDVNGSRIQVTALETIGNADQSISNQTAVTDLTEGWKTYQNTRYGYEFRYPDTATITSFGVMGVPPQEVPEGMGIEEYEAQLKAQYGDQICVQVEYALGVIYFVAPMEDGGKYTLCGNAGFGAGEPLDRSETLIIDHTEYTAEGFELIGPDETLSGHTEMLNLVFENGLWVGFGSSTRQDATFEDYQMNGHDMIRRIIETLKFTG